MKITQGIFTILMSLISLTTYCQANYGEPKDSANFKIEINPDFFLLGTFSDYNGRFKYIDREKQIDRYYPYEKPIAKYISKFIKEHYKVAVNTTLNASIHSEIISPKLAKQLHSEYFDKNGEFIDSKLNNEAKKYSFLAGVYYRYGEHLEGNIYKIQIANSPKDKIIYQILKDLECDKLVYKFLRDYIPASDIFYFEATPRMIKYFNAFKKEKEDLQKSYDDALLKKLGEGEKGKERKQRYDKVQNERIKNIRSVFE